MLNLHAFEPRSRANGPGLRAVLWFQGCDLGCPHCYNPETHSNAAHSNAARLRRSPSEMTTELEKLIQSSDGPAIEGLTLSGGEPLQQPEGLLELLLQVRQRTALSILLFSGYTLEEIRRQPLGSEILEQLDVLVDGRFQAGRRLAEGLRGSANQHIHLLTDRYTEADVTATPVAEIRIDSNGNVTISGVDPPLL